MQNQCFLRILERLFQNWFSPGFQSLQVALHGLQFSPKCQEEGLSFSLSYCSVVPGKWRHSELLLASVHAVVCLK